MAWNKVYFLNGNSNEHIQIFLQNMKLHAWGMYSLRTGIVLHRKKIKPSVFYKPENLGIFLKERQAQRLFTETEENTPN